MRPARNMAGKGDHGGRGHDLGHGRRRGGMVSPPARPAVGAVVWSQSPTATERQRPLSTAPARVPRVARRETLPVHAVTVIAVLTVGGALTGAGALLLSATVARALAEVLPTWLAALLVGGAVLVSGLLLLQRVWDQEVRSRSRAIHKLVRPRMFS